MTESNSVWKQTRGKVLLTANRVFLLLPEERALSVSLCLGIEDNYRRYSWSQHKQKFGGFCDGW